MGYQIWAFCVGIKSENIDLVVHFDTFIYRIRWILREKKLILWHTITNNWSNHHITLNTAYNNPQTKERQTTTFLWSCTITQIVYSIQCLRNLFVLSLPRGHVLSLLFWILFTVILYFYQIHSHTIVINYYSATKYLSLGATAKRYLSKHQAQ